MLIITIKITKAAILLLAYMVELFLSVFFRVNGIIPTPKGSNEKSINTR